jgi:DNA-binding winged helix-turn-helix (wHTH) protein/TolB-like protein/tetratricopeptide (TPR) repeat protein
MARDLYEFGPFRLDTTGRRLLRDGLPVALTPKAFDALAVLVEGRGRRLSREELVSHIWPDTTVSEDNLKQCIAVLRNALEDNPRSPTYIATLPGYGYAFVAEVHTRSNGNNDSGSNGNGSDHTPNAKISSVGSSAPAPMEVAGIQPARSSTSSKRWLIPAVAVALILTAAALITASPIRRKIFHQPRPNSVAVLPFQPLSAQSESEDEYLGLGLADAIITKLGNARSLHVRPIEEVSRYSGTVDPVKVGRDLAVGALLEGTIQRQGDKIRINARLLDTTNGTALWSDEIDSNINDMFAIEDNVVAEVETVLVANPRPPTQQTSGSTPAALALAHRDYMKGRFFWSKRTQQGITTAISLFQQAIEQDPQYAEAYDGIADSYSLLGFYGYLPPSESYPKAKAAALQALAINRNLPEPHVSLMIVATDYDWDWQTAETEFRAAIALKPNHAEAYQAHAYLLLALGQPDAAAREVEKALELDPLSPGFNMTLAWAYYLAHDYPRCLEECRRTRELYPDFVVAVQVAALAHVQQKDWQQAAAELAESRKLSPGNPMTGLLQAQILAPQDRPPTQQNEIRVQLKQFLHQSKPNVALSYYVAGAYAALGDNNDAFEALDQSYAARSNWLIYLKLDPRFDSLHNDPRFSTLLQKIGLSPEQLQTNRPQNAKPENNR